MSEDDKVLSFNASRVLARSCESLLGICQGLVADDTLNEREVVFLQLWLRDNIEIASVWPGCVVAERIESIVNDGVVTESELEDLKAVLASLLGGSLETTGATGGLSTTLPLDRAAKVVFPGKNFCFTGKFLYGTRKRCSAAVIALGGECVDSICHKMDYLVVGTLVSANWAYSSLGRKIESAVELQKNGHGLAIIGEEQWNEAIEAACRRLQ